jgi:predicted nucleic acid-binding Zn ribbon protein
VHEPAEDATDAAEVADDPVEVPHDDAGLDLARALTRATSRARPATGGPGAGPGRRARRTAAAPARDDAGRPDPGARRRGGSSGAHPDERDPQTLDSTLGRLVADHGWGLDLRVHGVMGRWRELVGSEVADHCVPESFADGRLTVRTDSTAWATQLRLLAPTVVRRLNEELGHGTVTVIDVLGPHLPSWVRGPRRVRDGRGPRDTYG